jgi:hypothetical protein
MNSRRFIANPAPIALNQTVSNFSAQVQGSDVRVGSLAEVEVADADFCLTPESGHPADITGSPLSATSRLNRIAATSRLPWRQRRQK